MSVNTTTIALAQPQPIAWIAYAPLLPLGLLSLSGVYFFVQPHLPKRRPGA